MKKIGLLIAGAAVVFSTAACANFSPATTVTHGADPGAGSTVEIKQNFPGAHDIKVVEAKGNPNYMEWHTPDGKKCTAFAFAVHFRSMTPGSLISAPYCR